MMESFKKSNSSYRYFVCEADGRRWMYHIRLNGLKGRDGTFYDPPPGSGGDIRDACRARAAEASDFQRMNLEPGTFFPRVWRGPAGSTAPLADVNEETRAIVATSVLVERMKQVFRVVEPNRSNLGTYGHEIRNLLLLAAMDAEANFKAILTANGYEVFDDKGRPRKKWALRDYQKLSEPMRLWSYRVELAGYPELGPVEPFAAWAPKASSKVLTWWADYNKTKHDRDASFARGTLDNAISAVAANAVLLWAQFGTLEGRQGAGSNIAAELNLDVTDPLPDDFLYVPRPDMRWEKTTLKASGVI